MKWPRRKDGKGKSRITSSVYFTRLKRLAHIKRDLLSYLPLRTPKTAIQRMRLGPGEGKFGSGIQRERTKTLHDLVVSVAAKTKTVDGKEHIAYLQSAVWKENLINLKNSPT